jgi:hypothetical protein
MSLIPESKTIFIIKENCILQSLYFRKSQKFCVYTHTRERRKGKTRKGEEKKRNMKRAVSGALGEVPLLVHWGLAWLLLWVFLLCILVLPLPVKLDLRFQQRILLPFLEEFVFQRLLRSRPLELVFRQTQRHKLFERLAEIPFERWRLILRDEIQYL